MISKNSEILKLLKENKNGYVLKTMLNNHFWISGAKHAVKIKNSMVLKLIESNILLKNTKFPMRYNTIQIQF